MRVVTGRRQGSGAYRMCYLDFMTKKLPEHVSILPPATGLSGICEPILRSAPQWFGIETSIQEYVSRIAELPTVLAVHTDPHTQEQKAVGFMSIEQLFPSSAELHVLCIRPEWHRKGIGEALLSASEAHARRIGARFLQVKTVSPKKSCDYYTRTRKFYEAVGFSPLTEFPTLWDPDCPCLQMIKALD